MKSEFQAERMHVVGERLETCAIGGGWELDGIRDQAAELVEAFAEAKLLVVVDIGVRSIPIEIDDDIFPTVWLEVLGKEFGMFQEKEPTKPLTLEDLSTENLAKLLALPVVEDGEKTGSEGPPPAVQ